MDEELGEHASWCKMTNYEIDTRVPLIISTPGLKNKNIKTDALVEFVDIYPTLCELSGLTIPDFLEGKSMVPVIQHPEESFKEAVYSQFLREGIWLAPDGIEYMGNSIRTNRYRYTEWINWETGTLVASELYDHNSDPEENKNIAMEINNKELITDLANQLHLVLPINKK